MVIILTIKHLNLYFVVQSGDSASNLSADVDKDSIGDENDIQSDIDDENDTAGSGSSDAESDIEIGADNASDISGEIFLAC